MQEKEVKLDHSYFVVFHDFIQKETVGYKGTYDCVPYGFQSKYEKYMTIPYDRMFKTQKDAKEYIKKKIKNVEFYKSFPGSVALYFRKR